MVHILTVRVFVQTNITITKQCVPCSILDVLVHINVDKQHFDLEIKRLNAFFIYTNDIVILTLILTFTCTNVTTATFNRHFMPRRLEL